MVHKRCHETGCPEGSKKNPRCEHGWYFHGEHTPRDGQRFVERGPMKHYLWLAPAGTQLPENRTQAEDLEKLIYAWMIAGRQPKPATPEPTPPAGDGEKKLRLVKDVATDYRDRHLKNSSDKNEPSCINRIIRELGPKPMTDLLMQRVLEDYLDEEYCDNSNATRNRAFSRLSNLVNYCRREFALEGPSPFRHQTLNPTGIGKLEEEWRRRGETFTEREDKALIKAMEKLGDGGMMLGRYYCACDAGARRGEMLALKSTTGIIRTPGKGLGYSLRFVGTTTKSGKPRDVPITTDRLLQFVLKRQKLEHPFGNLDGSRLDSFRIDWENVLLDSKLETGHWTENHTWVRDLDANLHWHDLRHVFATRLYLNPQFRGGVVRIQKLLGHADIETTMRYLNVGDEDAADAMLAANTAAGLAKRPKKGKARLRLVS